MGALGGGLAGPISSEGTGAGTFAADQGPDFLERFGQGGVLLQAAVSLLLVRDIFIEKQWPNCHLHM